MNAVPLREMPKICKGDAGVELGSKGMHALADYCWLGLEQT